SGSCEGCDGSPPPPAGARQAGPPVCRRQEPAGRYIRSGRPSWTSTASRTGGWLGRLDGNMTALNGAPRLARDRGQDLGGLAGLPGLEMVAGQLGERIAVLRAEQARRQAGVSIARPAWKNLVFTGGPGTGKSRAVRAVARVYRELGLLSSGHVDEVAAMSVVGTTPRETGILVGETVR